MSTDKILINHGKKWEDEEIKLLLRAIQRNDSKEITAARHQRTVGGIRSRQRHLAAEYYFNDNRSIEEIMKFTGLDKDSVLDAIQKKSTSQPTKIRNIKAMQNNISFDSIPSDSNQEIVHILNEIRDLLKQFVSTKTMS